MGNILPQTVADVLDVKVSDDCDSAKILTEMIVQEVMESANSVLNASADNSEEVYRRVTPPNRLGVMVSHACNMLKAFLAKMKGIFRLPERKESQGTLLEMTNDGLEEEVTSNKSWQHETSDTAKPQGRDLFRPKTQLLDLFSLKPQSSQALITARMMVSQKMYTYQRRDFMGNLYLAVNESNKSTPPMYLLYVATMEGLSTST
ncbi:hypothetical protein JOQ06_004877 [Pogonophryne albipinna]|uniref:Uncharacterized protein n=1 Tax=Pogonophryne albipinna TaxID=1090488 RepID=A0AAD6AQR3_9TELE|nr:hypothetical protein JOQ06_004877 [Pogonophryne albipinna]